MTILSACLSIVQNTLCSPQWIGCAGTFLAHRTHLDITQVRSMQINLNSQHSLNCARCTSISKENDSFPQQAGKIYRVLLTVVRTKNRGTSTRSSRARHGGLRERFLTVSGAIEHTKPMMLPRAPHFPTSEHWMSPSASHDLTKLEVRPPKFLRGIRRSHTFRKRSLNGRTRARAAMLHLALQTAQKSRSWTG